MSKRKYNEQFSNAEQKRVAADPNTEKHTLDSDEEDFVDETNVLDENDIEGEEDGNAGQDGEQRMTAFNMREELEEGHFDRDGHFIWNNEKEVRDNWLDNIDWHKIKQSKANKYDIEESGLADESESEEEKEDFSEIGTYKDIIGYMKPKESINKALKRLGGDMSKLSSVERLKRKKAGTLQVSEDVTKLTELANRILTRLGNMDVYQETYEQIQTKIDKSESKGKKLVKEAELDMYADDFDTQEKKKLNDQPSTSSMDDSTSSQDLHTPAELKWEFKWAAEDEKIEGPFNTSQMVKWQKSNYFKPGVMVRKCGEVTNFYSLSRIDFELYE